MSSIVEQIYLAHIVRWWLDLRFDSLPCGNRTWPVENMLSPIKNNVGKQLRLNEQGESRWCWPQKWRFWLSNFRARRKSRRVWWSRSCRIGFDATFLRIRLFRHVLGGRFLTPNVSFGSNLEHTVEQQSRSDQTPSLATTVDDVRDEKWRLTPKGLTNYASFSPLPT